VARARNIKPGFFKNEVLAEMPCEARLLFIGLWTLADREGRLEDRHRRIGAELFAFDRFDVDSMLTQLQDGGFLLRYEANGVRYIQIENFVKHQDPHYKEKASEIPPPDGRANLMLASGVTRTQRARILERDGYVCLSCGAKEHLCIDHILPVSRGGDSSDENLQTLCLSCNTKKGNKLDGETKNAHLRRDRIDFESRLAEQRGASPSESLSSDSPSSDSLIPDTSPNGEVSGPALRAAPPPPPAFDGKNAESLNGKAIVQIAGDWELPEQWGIDAEALGWKPSQVLHQSEKFRQYWTAGKGSGKRRSVKGWRQSWSNWLERAAKDQR
jgi:hypothetical protein